MTKYNELKRAKLIRERTASSLLRLREQLRKEIPPRTVSDSLLLATWNIREFDAIGRKHGPRLSESYYYIAEIISAFDLVAVQEVGADLKAIERVLFLLGDKNWDYLVTDVTEGRQGNRERIAFLFDKRKVWHRKITGEIVLPDRNATQFARTPFLVAFQSGWFKFMLCTVHIYYGAESGEELEQRKKEIRSVAQFLGKRAKADTKNSYILLGDFNIVSPEHETMQALLGQGFVIPQGLKDRWSNMKGDRAYDQIAFRPQPDPSKPEMVVLGDGAGVFNYYKSIFREEDSELYYQVVAADKDRSTKLWDTSKAGQPPNADSRRRYYKDTWRTFQMSDHLPMWVELKIDFSREYLEALAEP